MQTQQSQANPPSEFPHLAVAVKHDGTHVGLLYRVTEAPPKFLHLGWHHELYDDDTIRNGYAWAACSGFDDHEGRDMASWLRKIYQANIGRIPYGFNYWPGACFDEDGLFTPSREGLGLTCATFVMALFEAQSYPIANVASWKARADDQEWFKKVVHELRTHSNASAEHIQAQIDGMGRAVRFRPLEVVACASSYEEDSIGFEQAVSLAAEFVEDLTTNWNGTPPPYELLARVAGTEPKTASADDAEQVSPKDGKNIAKVAQAPARKDVADAAPGKEQSTPHK
ncbi:hypothetical protein QZM18_13970 [Burkholderia diffusa]|uniref:hypothetical protein n=1 Tax=Burkholderia diffusa TaxID=488732 RepID=UPI00265120ED|nr:hypothetical protein [Burkholderia diffusa]MDN7905219.1 hypothetical protein [Burkholderia diffusa]